MITIVHNHEAEGAARSHQRHFNGVTLAIARRHGLVVNFHPEGASDKLSAQALALEGKDEARAFKRLQRHAKRLEGLTRLAQVENEGKPLEPQLEAPQGAPRSRPAEPRRAARTNRGRPVKRAAAAKSAPEPAPSESIETAVTAVAEKND